MTRTPALVVAAAVGAAAVLWGFAVATIAAGAIAGARRWRKGQRR